MKMKEIEQEGARIPSAPPLGSANTSNNRKRGVNVVPLVNIF